MVLSKDNFWDASARIGLPRNQPPEAGPVTIGGSAEELLAEMDRAGIASALVWHVAQADYDAATGNGLLAEAIAPHPRLLGCWSILPPHTGELYGPGGLDLWLRIAEGLRIKAMRAMPSIHGYLLRRESLGAILEALAARQVPLVLPRPHVDWPAVYDLLADFPTLTVILGNVGWANERIWRPLLQRYPRCHVETGSYFVSGGIEGVVRDLGAERLLFGSGFPEAYMGAAMLALQGSAISDEAKAAIAGGNLRRLLSAAWSTSGPT